MVALPVLIGSVACIHRPWRWVAALTSLVSSHGSEAVALLVEGLPERIRAGEYDLERVIQ